MHVTKVICGPHGPRVNRCKDVAADGNSLVGLVPQPRHLAAASALCEEDTMKCSPDLSESTFGRRLERTGKPSLLIAALLLAACRQTAEPVTGFLTASVRESADAGVVETAYEGSGSFAVGQDPGAGVSIAFGLRSDGTGASAGQSFGLTRPGQGRPAPGRYDLAPLELSNGQMNGFTAHYQRHVPGRAEDFTAVSGYLVVHESTEDRVTGEFQVTMIQYCLANDVPGPDDWCVAPTTITQGAPRIAVAGSFTAVPVRVGQDSPTLP